MIFGPPLFIGGYSIAPGQQEFTSSGTLTVPAAARSLSIAAIGPGSDGVSSGSQPGDGGGGGAWASSNDIPVTPGETLAIDITSSYSRVSRGATVLVRAMAANGQTGGQADDCIGDARRSGGNGGNRGASKGGGNGGGAATFSADGPDGANASSTGGDGGRGVVPSTLATNSGGTSSSANGADGGSYGGGGGGRAGGAVTTNGQGAGGVVRIVWGQGRGWPNAAGDV